MALVDREPMTDATGSTHMYRPVPDTPDPVTGHREPPEHPHPDAILHARWSGWGIPPDETRSLEDVIAYQATHPDGEGHPVSGDETARFRRWRSQEHYWPRFRDIAHTLYPAGTIPVRTEPWTPPEGWVIPSQPRIPKWSPYTAHYSVDPSQTEGNVRVLCDQWLRVSKPVRPRPDSTYCLACARLIPREPEQLDLLDYLESTR